MGTASRFRRALWLLPVAAVLLGGGALAVLLASGVRVTAVSPANGQDGVPITAPLRITFSQPMEPASVRAHLRIDPETAVRVVVEGRDAVFWPFGAWVPGTAYTITLEAGAASLRGRSEANGRIWQFRTRAPQLLFLGRAAPGSGVHQLYLAPLDGTPPRALTDLAGGVWDYAVHPQGEGIVYSALREDGGADLWRMGRDGGNPRQLLACPGAACVNPTWSPDGRRLAYERRDIFAGAPNLDPKAGRIWILELPRGTDTPLFDYDVPLHSPVWSPDGARLAYASPTLPGVEVYDLRSQKLQQFGNQWGVGPVWSPDGAQLVVPDLLLAGEALVVRLTRLDLAVEQVVDISGDENLVKDDGPAWSPAGGWIAFGRQYLDKERWTPGRQIWLTRPDASEAQALPEEQTADRFAYAWRPDGGALAYLRADLAEGQQPVPDVSVWLFDFVGRTPVQVAAEGVLPKWLP